MGLHCCMYMVPGHGVVVGYEALLVLLPGPVSHVSPHLVHVAVVGVQQVSRLEQEAIFLYEC
jgi:hypothetical protein